ncbi:hypothetical protein L21SP5_00471 [Salinivirga cyanobacteriivorans]|uniref:Uncharacterized protein n=1 Tax=Salinivirga cyanobacteriivorans TaxID=1307839 RepID=A0A0S2HVT5_9BACT|nr:hypothetical protein L21SP5_00471 [Salinivirga cyanobacteriivorans]
MQNMDFVDKENGFPSLFDSFIINVFIPARF